MIRLANTTLTHGVSGLRLLFCSLSLLLAGCGDKQFAYLDGGGGQSLSVVREQSYLGGRGIQPWFPPRLRAVRSVMSWKA